MAVIVVARRIQLHTINRTFSLFIVMQIVVNRIQNWQNEDDEDGEITMKTEGGK